MKLPQIVLVLLCAIVTASASHAATRVFYDGSESGNANLWNQVDLRDKCVSVTSSADGVAGPYSGSRMFRCNSNGTANWSATNSYETMAIPPFSMNNEVLYRIRIRLDQNQDRTSGSPKKIARIFGPLSETAVFESTFAGSPGFVWGGYINNYQLTNYWGGMNGDTTMNSSSWHTLEYYYNKATGVVKVWHDGAQVFYQTLNPITGSVGENGVFYLTSNFSDPHDATNYIYFDNIEVFTDSANGTPATGSMADGTVGVSGGGTTYTVTPSASANGTISPNTTQTVNSGSTTAFTVTPSGGYTASVGGTCGGSLVGTTYTTNVITGNCTVSATFSVSGSGPVARAECASPPSGTIYCADFEEASDSARRAKWDDYDGATDVVFATDSGPSQDGANTVARFLAGSGQPYGADLVKVLPSTYDILYLRYYQYFDAGYSLSWAGHGGGLTAGSRDGIGSSGNRPTGTDYADFSMEYSTAGHLRSYNYYRGMYQDCSNPVGSCYGDSFPCDYDSGANYCTKPHHIKHSSVSWPTFATGTWRCVEQMIDMGGSSASHLNGTDPNGRYQIWIDGVALGDYEDLWLRTNTSLKLQNLYMAWRNTSGTEHGSVGQRFDNIVVSTQRVGCGTTTTDKTAPTASAVLPTGTVSSPVTLSLATSETCAAAYSPTRVGHRYKTAFATTNSTSHSSSVAFANGSYTEYYTCMDAAGNLSVPSLASFTVAATDTTAPTATINTSDPSKILAASLAVAGTASDGIGVIGCKWRIGSAPNASNGTVCSGTTSFLCSTSAYAFGANTLYVGCYDLAGNYGSDSIVVNYIKLLPVPSNFRILTQ